MGNTVTATRITPGTALGYAHRICTRCGIEFGTNPKRPKTMCVDCRIVEKGQPIRGRGGK